MSFIRIFEYQMNWDEMDVSDIESIISHLPVIWLDEI